MKKKPDRSIRVVSVPILTKDGDTLKQLGATAACLANELFRDKYYEAKGGYTRNDDGTVYTDYSAKLGSYVRDSINVEVQTVWRKLCKQVLAGYRAAPIFWANRALSVRDRGITIIKDKDNFDIRLTLLPADGKDFTLRVYKRRLKKDLWLADLLDRLSAHKSLVRKAWVIHDRRTGRIYVHIAYSVTLIPIDRGDRIARVGPIGENGELYIRTDGAAQSLTHYIQLMQNTKATITGRWARVRLSKRRKAMATLQKFEHWVKGPLHQLSQSIVQFSLNRKCGVIEWRIYPDKQDGSDLPIAKLRTFVEYKAREYSIEVRDEKTLLGSTKTKGELEWVRQAKKTIRELGQATRKM